MPRAANRPRTRPPTKRTAPAAWSCWSRGEDAAGPDLFEVTFTGGAAGTQLTRLVIDGDHNGTPGVQDGDLFFDTARQDSTADPTALGRGDAYGFEVVEKIGDFNVTASVTDGQTSIVLHFSGFDAGEKLIFSIDVDEANNLGFRPGDPNAGVDEIASGNNGPFIATVSWTASID